MEIPTADTRRRALAVYERGIKTQSEVATIFGITLRTFQRWLQVWRTEGRDAPGRSPGRPAIFVGAAADRLRGQVADRPDATLEELAQSTGQIAHYSTVHRALERMKLPYKKRRSARQNKTGPT
jgi:transposase